MNKVIRIGTRESQLAVWQATLVQGQLAKFNILSELVFIKSEGDIDLQTPLYEIGVTGIFTRSLDIALLNNKIDIAVHSMKDVPTQLANGICQAAVLPRASYKDIFVFKSEEGNIGEQLGYVNGKWVLGNETSGGGQGDDSTKPGTTPTSSGSSFKVYHAQNDRVPHTVPLTIATSSIRRQAQWLHRYPNHTIENLRGNVNTRLRKVQEQNWHGAIFAAAGLERINLRPQQAIDLDWMLPAPAQGAIMIVCREGDENVFTACRRLNDEATATCTKIERDFLKTLLGGCSTPISALAEYTNEGINFSGNILSADGKQKIAVAKTFKMEEKEVAGKMAGEQILKNGGAAIVAQIQHAK